MLEAIAKVDTDSGTELVVLPECALCGFPSLAQVDGVSQPVDGPGVTAVREAARKKKVAVAVGFGEKEDGKILQFHRFNRFIR